MVSISSSHWPESLCSHGLFNFFRFGDGGNLADYDSHRARGGDAIQPHTAAPCVDDAAFSVTSVTPRYDFIIRIIIVLSLLRQALGTMQTPPNRVLLGIALFLTLFVMEPVLTAVYDTAIFPYLNEEISIEAAIAAAEAPMRGFMLNQTRQEDIAMFTEIAGDGPIAGPEEVPFSILAPAFITSELKSAFVIGFMIYIPFVILDLIVASVLMSMGMMMLSPMMISMPFKLMLFVLVDGWTLIMGSLASSFAMP